VDLRNDRDLGRLDAVDQPVGPREELTQLRGLELGDAATTAVETPRARAGDAQGRAGSSPAPRRAHRLVVLLPVDREAEAGTLCLGTLLGRTAGRKAVAIAVGEVTQLMQHRMLEVLRLDITE
jgi:hypothetical protein